MKTTNDILSVLDNSYRYEQYGNSYSHNGILVEKNFFEGGRIPCVGFGKIYYAEFDGVLCQIRLVQIEYYKEFHDWTTTFEMAYNGNVVKYEWGRVNSNGGVRGRYTPIYASVADFKRKNSVQTKYATFMSLFNTLTDHRYNGVYTGGAHYSGSNYMHSYKWNGAKAVATHPNLFTEMTNRVKITADGVLVGFGAKPYQIIALRDNGEFYTTRESCEDDNEIVISTFGGEETETKAITKVKITIEVTNEEFGVIKALGIGE